MRRLASIIAALLLALAPARADFGVGGHLQGFWAASDALPSLLAATCAMDAVNRTTYTFSGISTGASDGDSVLVIAGILSDDGNKNTTVVSSTIEGAAASTLVQTGGGVGSDNIAQAAIISSGALITGAASVDVTVTFSLEHNGAAACVWVLKDLTSVTPVDTESAAVGNGAALTLDLTTQADGFAVGACAGEEASGTHAWTGLTVREDFNITGDGRATNADAATTTTSLAITCDWSSSKDSSGVSASFR